MPQGEILGHAVGLDRGGKALCGRNNYQGSVARADSQRRTSVHDDSLLSKCPPIGRALPGHNGGAMSLTCLGFENS